MIQLPPETQLMGFSTVGETEQLRINLDETCKGLPEEIRNKIGNLVIGFIKKSFMPSELLSAMAGNNPKKDIEKYKIKFRN